MPETENNIDCSHLFGGKPGPTVRILLYTDDPVRVKTDVVENMSLGVMLQHIGTHAPAFANLCFKFVCRNSSASFHADQRIDDLIRTGDFDQIWFFGVHQGNRNNPTGVFLDGGPKSELDDDEIKSLENWMRIGVENGQRGGGVLMTGDHAEQFPDGALFSEPAPASGLWGIGRALGTRVPRARKMRHWDGPPRSGAGSQNTYVSRDGNFENTVLQYDDMPQRLNLTPQGQTHPLFFYRQGTFIDVFPDHMHEGAIRMPGNEDLSDTREWPGSVGPEVVARGTDNSKGGVQVDLISAYNGDQLGVGRIVADSTWHHYFNLNLRGFGQTSDVDSPADKIGQFYANLAVWLTPLPKRLEMANAMIEWVATPRSPLEEVLFADLGFEASNRLIANLGKAGYQMLEQLASPCEVHELCSLLRDAENATTKMAFLESDSAKEMLLGSLIQRYQKRLVSAASEKSESAKIEATANNPVESIEDQNSVLLTA